MLGTITVGKKAFGKKVLGFWTYGKNIVREEVHSGILVREKRTIYFKYFSTAIAL